MSPSRQALGSSAGPAGLRIAVLFFGLPRCSALSVPSIEENVLSVLRRMPAVGAVQSFFHFYLQNAVVNPRSGERGELDRENYTWFEQNASGQLSNPDEVIARSVLADIEAYGDAFADNGASLRNLILQLHSLEVVTEIAQNAGEFDVLVYLRPDLQYHDPLPEWTIGFSARHPDACVVPDWQWWSGINDRFAVCGRAAANVYGRRVRAARRFCEETATPLHSERLLKRVLRSNSIRLRTMSVRASRLRIGGVPRAEEFRPFEALEAGRRTRWWLKALQFISSVRLGRI